MPKVAPGYKEEAKARILEAARAAFSQKGYHETTLEEIAARLKVSKGAIYVYFKSKEQLFNEIYKYGLGEIQQLLAEPFDEKELFSLSKGFYDRIRSTEMLTPGLRFELLAEASRNPKLGRVLRENYGAAVVALQRFLDKRKAEGLIKDEVDTRILALLLLAVYEGMGFDSAFGVERSDLEQVWEMFVEGMFKTVTNAD